MSGPPLRAGVRERAYDEREVRPVELFLDLVYVLAVTQVTHYLLDHLTARGMVETLILLLIVWLGWIHVVWTTNYIHLGTMRVRLMLLSLMLRAWSCRASLPEAFGDRGLAFALATVVLSLLSSAFFLFAIGRGHRLSRIVERAATWWTAVCALLVAGALVDDDARAWPSGSWQSCWPTP